VRETRMSERVYRGWVVPVIKHRVASNASQTTLDTSQAHVEGERGACSCERGFRLQCPVHGVHVKIARVARDRAFVQAFWNEHRERAQTYHQGFNCACPIWYTARRLGVV
jgi:hypothetical protein